MSRIISKTLTVLKGKRIIAFKICIQIDSVNLDYMWASHLKNISIFSATSAESLFKIYLITNITIQYKDSQKVICIKPQAFVRQIFWIPGANTIIKKVFVFCWFFFFQGISISLTLKCCSFHSTVPNAWISKRHTNIPL